MDESTDQLFIWLAVRVSEAFVAVDANSDNLDASKWSNTYIDSYECVHRDLGMFRRSSKQNDVGYAQDFDC